MLNPALGKVVLFMPAYHAEKTLETAYCKIPKDMIDEIILVDDASGDGIQAVAEKLGILLWRNERNLGYGGNIKSCLQKALDHSADILIEFHPDDQYDPASIQPALEKIRQGYDFVMGSRFIEQGAALANRMPLWKYAINRTSTYFLQAVLGIRLTEFHCGFRVYTRRFLEAVPYQRNDDDYLFSFQIIVQAIKGKFKIAEVPIRCRYYDGVTQINVRKTAKYGLGVMRTLLLRAN